MAFDIAIIGAGSSGCALAGRLAARTDFRIALIEAGPDYGPRASGSWPADLVDAHRLTRQPLLARAIRRGPRRFTSDVRLARFVRANVTDYGHSVGTCRMGLSPGDGDVVDASTRVHGLANVFVVDASVIPQIPRANTNFTCFVLGMRAADFVGNASG